MIEAFRELDPRWQALAAGVFTWLVTALGAAGVFLSKRMPIKLLDSMLGFAAGVMIAASFFSLLAPAIALSEEMGMIRWLPAAVGFVAGAAMLRIVDQFLPHLHPQLPLERTEGVKTHWERATLLVLAITLHNIPEGLAVGVAFGAAHIGMDAGGATFAAAVALTLGIAMQNFPEGVAVAMPLRQAGVSSGRSFWYGQLSALVEPVAAVIGAAAVLWMRPLLPFALAFAAGAMIYVVVEELIPEAQQGGHEDIATSATIVGFTVMMILDVALG
ncbi:MAG TPA: ZIP family metal transporter [Longimicrobiales bacterium]